MKNMFKTRLIVSFIFLLLVLGLFGFKTEVQAATSVTRGHTTWTFDKDYEVGQFVTGSWWVLDTGGGVVITNITNTHHSGLDLSTVDYDGSQLDTHRIKTSFYGNESSTGFDSRGVGYTTANNINHSLPYSLTSGHSILSSASWLLSDAGHPSVGGDGQPRPKIKQIVTLTAVSSIPSVNTFRPSYAEGADVFYETSQVDYTRVSSLVPPVGTPLLSEVEDNFVYPWIDPAQEAPSEQLRGTDNYPMASNTYNQWIAAAFGDAVLMANLDSGSIGNKTNLINSLIQVGIDYHGLLLAGATWPCNGGHQHGYKFPILFAGQMLNNNEMLSVGVDYNLTDSYGRAYFQEDGDMWYITTADYNRTVCGRSGNCDAYMQYNLTDHPVGTPEWGIRHVSSPSQDDGSYGASYRAINSGSLPGHTLTAMMMGLRDEWNREALFDYVDRWVPWSRANNPSETFYSGFTESMWDTYRDNYGTVIRADVDQNSTINSTDAMLTLRNSLGLSMAGTNWQTSATTGDVNCDDITNSTDAMLLLRYSLGLSMDGTGWCID